MRTKQKSSFADRKMLGRAIKDSFAKLSPKTQAKTRSCFCFCECDLDQYPLGGIPVRVMQDSDKETVDQISGANP